MILTTALTIVLLTGIPLQTNADEICILERSEEIGSGSFAVMVTAGTVGVAASAGLLILSNRR